MVNNQSATSIAVISNIRKSSSRLNSEEHGCQRQYTCDSCNMTSDQDQMQQYFLMEEEEQVTMSQQDQVTT
jgi:hypothetical protein